MAQWTDAELRSTVRAYLKMLSAQDRDLAYSKAETRRRLLRGALKGRSAASVEYRMRNISAVLEQHGRTTLKGYLAAKNVGDAVSEKIWAMVRELDSSPPKAASGAGSGAASKQAGGAVKWGKRPPMIYFNIGWMEHYAGPSPDDLTIGAHRYLGSHDHGAECYNFLADSDGILRGYRPPGGRARIDLKRLGAAASDISMDGVLVIWLAREPGTGRTLIVGWYRDATVYRQAQPGSVDINGEKIEYSVEAREEDGTLLPWVLRTFAVRSSRVSPGAGFGQNPTWYGADSIDELVWSYIRSEGKAPRKKGKPSGKPPKNFDPELRRKVERAAVNNAVAYYKALYGNDCPVVSVETEAKGWDLEVHAGPQPRLVEVKGLLNHGMVCELTPNEYEKMQLPANRDRYTVFIVNNALAEPPSRPSRFVFEHAGGMVWQTADGLKLKITKKVGAVLSVV
jgi:hypothetical protein